MSPVQFSSVSQSCPILCGRMDCSTPGFPVHLSPVPPHYPSPLLITNSQSLLKLMSIELVMPSKHLIFVVSFSFGFQSFPASGSFLMSQFFESGGQSIGVSASASVLSMNSQDWFPLGWIDWISLQSKGLSRVFSHTTVQKYQFFSTQLSLESNSHIHTWPMEKTITLTRQTFAGKVMSLLFNMLSRLVITFLPRSKRLLISWLQSPSAVILESPKIKPVSCHCFSISLPWSDGTGCRDLSFLNVEF